MLVGSRLDSAGKSGWMESTDYLSCQKIKIPRRRRWFGCGQLDGAGQETMRRVDGRQAQALSKLPDN